MKTVIFAGLVVIAMLAFSNTFGRAMINDYHAEKVAADHTEYEASKKAKEIKACESGKTNLIMVNGKFCNR